MKKISAILILLSLILTLIACSGDSVETPDGMQYASSSDVAYNLFVPGGWILTEQNGIYGAYYSSEDRSSMTVSSISPTEDMGSIAEYWEVCKASYGETYKNFTAIEEETQTLLGEKTGYRYVFTADIDGVSYKFMQIFTIHGSLFYTFTYTSTAENYDLHLEDVEKTMSEMVFK